MSNTLVKTPLRLSLSMTAGHDLIVDLNPVVDDASRPLGYVFSTVAVKRGVRAEHGYYDPATQTWVPGRGDITAGVPTRTRVRHTCIYVTDEHCN